MLENEITYLQNLVHLFQVQSKNISTTIQNLSQVLEALRSAPSSETGAFFNEDEMEQVILPQLREFKQTMDIMSAHWTATLGKVQQAQLRLDEFMKPFVAFSAMIQQATATQQQVLDQIKPKGKPDDQPD